VVGDFTLALADRGTGDQFHDPSAARPVGLDVLWRLLDSELPAGLTPMALLDIHCCERDLAPSLELAADLPVEGVLVGFNGQQEVGPLIRAPAKNACVVCSASAWIRTPMRSSVLSSSLSAACSLTVVGIIGRLGQGHAKNTGLDGDLRNEQMVAVFYLDGGTSQGFAVADQLVQTIAPTWDLADQPSLQNMDEFLQMSLIEQIEEGGV